MTIAERYFAEFEGKRGQLEEGFKEFTILSVGAVPGYLSKEVARPRLTDDELEDLSHLNPKSSKLNKARAKEAWQGLNPQQREEWAKVRRTNAGKQKIKNRKARNGQKK